jgi:hypothetical protein
MRFRVLLLLAATLAFGQWAKADASYDYSLGVSLQNTVAPGSLVSINAVLLNTGTATIIFAPAFTSGTPSAQGGSVPSGGAGEGGQWNILADGFSFNLGQFAGVTIAPGQGFAFTFGTFQAPTNQPTGSTATLGVNLAIDFTDTITGNLEAVCPGACTFQNSPTLDFTLGNTASSSSMTYFQATVPPIVPTVVQVPEPASWELFGFTAIALAGCLLRFRRRA